MTPDEFKQIRQSLGHTQEQLATALGLSRGTIENYERGQRREDGRAVEIPKSVQMALHFLSLQVAARNAGMLLPTLQAREAAHHAMRVLYSRPLVHEDDDPRNAFEVYRDAGMIDTDEPSLLDDLGARIVDPR